MHGDRWGGIRGWRGASMQRASSSDSLTMPATQPAPQLPDEADDPLPLPLPPAVPEADAPPPELDRADEPAPPIEPWSVAPLPTHAATRGCGSPFEVSGSTGTLPRSVVVGRQQLCSFSGMVTPAAATTPETSLSKVTGPAVTPTRAELETVV